MDRTVLVSALAIAPVLAVLVVPWLVRFVGSILGRYLNKKTDGRRTQLLGIMRDDETAYQDQRQPLQRPSGAGLKPTAEGEDDWEHISAEVLANFENSKAANKEWDGIVGFFHPFW